MRLRVAPPPASSRSARVAAPGCPVPRSLSAEPASESSGCPLVSALRLCRRCPSELPRTSHAFGVTGFSEVLGFPSCARPLLQRPRCRTQVSPRPAPPALPVIDRRVASILSTSAVPVVKASSRPDALRPRYRRRSVSGSPRMLILRHRLMGCPSYLGSRTFRFASLESPDRSGYPALATPINQFPGRPKSWVSQRSPIPFVSSRPETRFLG